MFHPPGEPPGAAFDQGLWFALQHRHRTAVIQQPPEGAMGSMVPTGPVGDQLATLQTTIVVSSASGSP